MRAAKRSKGLVDGHTDELADTLAKIGATDCEFFVSTYAVRLGVDDEEDKKIGQV